MKKLISLLSIILYACGGSGSSNSTENNINAQLSYIDISYGAHFHQKLDFVFPKNYKNMEKMNVVLFIHGGGWQEGDKSVYRQALQENADNNKLLSVAMNYRLLGDNANCEDMLEDIHNAILKIAEIGDANNININKIFLMGASAGAHLSLLYSYKYYQVSPITIAFCVAQSAPADFTDPLLYNNHQDLPPGIDWEAYMFDAASKLTGESITKDNFHGKKEALLKVSPVNYISSNIPPTVFAHGKKDLLVSFSNAEKLRDALNSVNATYAFYIYENSGHELDNMLDSAVNIEFYTKIYEYFILYF